MLSGKYKVFAIITFVMLLFGNAARAASKGEVLSADELIELAIEKSWESTNNQLDYIDENRPKTSSVPDTSWRNNDKFRETIYETIPQLLKDCWLSRGLFAKTSGEENDIIDCGVNFEDEAAVRRLTPANWNYILFVNCLKFIGREDSVKGVVDEKNVLLGYELKMSTKKVNWLISIFPDFFEQRRNVICCQDLIRIVGLVLKETLNGRYNEEIEAAIMDIEKYVDQLNMDRLIVNIGEPREPETIGRNIFSLPNIKIRSDLRKGSYRKKQNADIEILSVKKVDNELKMETTKTKIAASTLLKMYTDDRRFCFGQPSSIYESSYTSYIGSDFKFIINSITELLKKFKKINLWHKQYNSNVVLKHLLLLNFNVHSDLICLFSTLINSVVIYDEDSFYQFRVDRESGDPVFLYKEISIGC